VNHQTELDWIFSCYFLQMFGKESDFSAVMKGSLG
jgi:singapore isolate B (sub-type 7) whole genome shotgun sequence assembly, scaffold_6